MNKKRNQAIFITFEGIEGSGKTTQIRMLSKHLKSLGIKHILTREPGGTEFGDRLRKLILIPKFQSLEPYSELFVMLAARCDHIARIIKKNLEKGITVLCDRFSDATLAYQGGGRKLKLRLIEKLNILATSGIKPDLTFLLDLPVETGLKRARTRLSFIKLKNRESRFENEAFKFHRRVRTTYLRIYRSDRKRIHLIDASKDKYKIADEIRGTVLNELKSDKRSRKS